MNILSNRLHYLAFTGSLNVNADAIKVALMTSAYVPDKDTNTFDNTDEITGTGYTTGGKDLTGSVMTQEDALDLAKWDADDISWSGSTLTARYAVAYNTTRANAILFVIDFGTDKISSEGLFVLKWNSAGILNQAQA